MAKQTEFAKKAMEAAIANTRDIAELVQKSSSEAFKIVQDRMKESYEEIKASVEKKVERALHARLTLRSARRARLSGRSDADRSFETPHSRGSSG